MTRLIAFSENDVASFSFYHCDCGTYFKVLQEQSRDASMHRCECGASVMFSGRVVTLWKTALSNPCLAPDGTRSRFQDRPCGRGSDSDGHA